MQRVKVKELLSTKLAKDGAAALAALLVCGTLTGCVVVGGSSRGGFFLWPGGFGLILLILLVVFLLRRR